MVDIFTEWVCAPLTIARVEEIVASVEAYPNVPTEIVPCGVKLPVNVVDLPVIETDTVPCGVIDVLPVGLETLSVCVWFLSAYLAGSIFVWTTHHIPFLIIIISPGSTVSAFEVPDFSVGIVNVPFATYVSPVLASVGRSS